MEERKQNITIKIADVAPISLTIDSSDEEVARMAERQVNKVWNTWRQEFDGRTSKEILAMAAYQFARRYYTLLASVNDQKSLLKEFEAELDNLLGIGDAPSSAVHPDVVK